MFRWMLLLIGFSVYGAEHATIDTRMVASEMDIQIPENLDQFERQVDRLLARLTDEWRNEFNKKKLTIHRINAFLEVMTVYFIDVLPVAVNSLTKSKEIDMSKLGAINHAEILRQALIMEIDNKKDPIGRELKENVIKPSQSFLAWLIFEEMKILGHADKEDTTQLLRFAFLLGLGQMAHPAFVSVHADNALTHFQKAFKANAADRDPELFRIAICLDADMENKWIKNVLSIIP